MLRLKSNGRWFGCTGIFGQCLAAAMPGGIVLSFSVHVVSAELWLQPQRCLVQPEQCWLQLWEVTDWVQIVFTLSHSMGRSWCCSTYQRQMKLVHLSWQRPTMCCVSVGKKKKSVLTRNILKAWNADRIWSLKHNICNFTSTWAVLNYSSLDLRSCQQRLWWLAAADCKMQKFSFIFYLRISMIVIRQNAKNRDI